MKAVIFHNKDAPDDQAQWFGHMSLDELIEGRMDIYGIDVQGYSRDDVLSRLRELLADEEEEWEDDYFELEVVDL